MGEDVDINFRRGDIKRTLKVNKAVQIKKSFTSTRELSFSRTSLQSVVDNHPPTPR